MVRAGAAGIALNPASPLARLMAGPVQPGVVRWIGVRLGRRQQVVAVDCAVLEPGQGVLGDRWRGSDDGKRQVSLIGEENLYCIARFLGRDHVPPELLRRNLVVSGINLLALKEQRVRVGGALLEVTGECHPCSRMEEELGPGGYNAVRGQGGLIARVISGGPVRLGDRIERYDAEG